MAPRLMTEPTLPVGRGRPVATAEVPLAFGGGKTTSPFGAGACCDVACYPAPPSSSASPPPAQPPASNSPPSDLDQVEALLRRHHLADGRKDGAGTPTATASKGMGMRKSTSMMDFGELKEIAAFEEAMREMASGGAEERPERMGPPPPHPPASGIGGGSLLNPKGADGNNSAEDFFFFDEEEKKPSAKADPAPPPPVVNQSVSGGMRRIQSFAGTATSTLPRRASFFAPDVHPIAEDSVDNSSSPARPIRASYDPMARPVKSAMKVSTSRESVTSIEPGTGEEGRRGNFKRQGSGSFRRRGSKNYSQSGSGRTSNSTTSSEDVDAKEDSSSAPPPLIRRNSVSFSTLEIREYDVKLGDNPAGSSGPPLTLSWDVSNQVNLGLDEYENSRGPRRTKRQMHMGHNARWWKLMRESGHTVLELKRATEEASQIRKQRKKTINSLKTAKVQEAWESAGRKFKRLLK